MSSEFNKIANYLLGIDNVPDALGMHYEKAIQEKNTQLSSYEQKIWNRMLKSKFFFGIYDSGFSLSQPDSNVRKKIFIALAILESNEHYHKYFINEKSLLSDFLQLTYKVPLAIIQAVLGIILIRFKL
ncbi:hypothetical protein [Tenacibaculum sp. 190524A05c]|uniref:Uncharacterized protein n=1 Tax=Tenacibaculum platacis TaxID=3137852 RepID=A0ABP1EQ06_9FLAO